MKDNDEQSIPSRGSHREPVPEGRRVDYCFFTWNPVYLHKNDALTRDEREAIEVAAAWFEASGREMATRDADTLRALLDRLK